MSLPLLLVVVSLRQQIRQQRRVPLKTRFNAFGGNNMARPIGIYEKATPKHFTWLERLQFAKALGFDFVEMSVDESDARLARLDWSKEERLDIVKAIYETGIRIPTICFSGHRRYPLGSNNPEIEAKSLELMKNALNWLRTLVFVLFN